MDSVLSMPAAWLAGCAAALADGCDLTSGQRENYDIVVPPGQMVNGVADQRGVDLTVRFMQTAAAWRAIRRRSRWLRTQPPGRRSGGPTRGSKMFGQACPHVSAKKRFGSTPEEARGWSWADLAPEPARGPVHRKPGPAQRPRISAGARPLISRAPGRPDRESTFPLRQTHPPGRLESP